jgi:ComF family protein
MLITQYLKDFIDLLYPRTCPTCGQLLSQNEDWLCTACLIDMPESDYWNVATNPVNQIFWGRTKIVFASAYLMFTKGSRYRKLIHNLKYKSDQTSGLKLGEYYGRAIVKASHYPPVDYIIPVPLHPKKQKKRGYNQSACIAKGLSESLYVPVLEDVLLRKVHTKTQTKMNKDERWENVSGAFVIDNTIQIENKHILLVDDVITTGATIEHCATTILSSCNCRVSIACIARA